MDINAFRYFVALDKYKTISKTARKLFQTVDKVPAKAGLFYIYNRFSGIMELSERRCFL